MLTKRFFFPYLIVFAIMTGVNFIISVVAPKSELVAMEREKNEILKGGKDAPIRQNELLYADALKKTQLKSCPDVEDDEGNRYFNCDDGEKITMTRWTRNGGDRKGIVTRWYDKTGKLKLIYGHPDDTK